MKNSHIIISLISFFLYIAAPCSIHSQNTISLGVASGLSNSYVQGVTEDIDGCFWFATEEGVDRFDGTNYMLPTTKDNLPLAKDDVNCILASKDSTHIYIGTRTNGLYRYDYTSHQLIKYPVLRVHNQEEKHHYGISSGSITALIWGEDNQLWIGHYNSGIDSYNVKSNTFTHYKSQTVAGLRWESVWALAQIGDNLFIAHNNEGLSKLNLTTEEVNHFEADPNNIDKLADNNIHCLSTDQHGLLWCGTEQGLSLFNPKNNTFKSFKVKHSNSNLSNDKILDLQINKEGTLYIGIEFKGIHTADLNKLVMHPSAYLEAKQLKKANSSTTLSNFSVRDILLDKYENVWIGTYGGGVLVLPHRTSPLKNISYRPNDHSVYSLSNPTAWGIAVNEKGEKLIGTDGKGIDIVYGNTVKKRVTQIANAKDPAILCMHKDLNNNIWIGCYKDGLYLYNSKQNNYKKIALSKKGKVDVRCLFQDEDTLLVGTDSGLFSVDINTHKETNYWNKKNSQLISRLVRSVYVNDKHEILIGAYGGGLTVYDRNMKLIRHIEVKNGLPSNRVNAILQDSHKNYWIGTMKGLVKIDSKWAIQDTLTIKDDLSNTRIKALIEKPVGQLWISTEYGINNLNLKNNKVHSFVSSSIPLYGFKAGSVASDSTHVYFGSISGLWEFNPITLMHEKRTTHPRITSLQVTKIGHQGEPSFTNYSGGYPNKLDYTQNNLEFTFNEADIALSNLVKYSYRLEGSGDEWSLPSTKNTVRYRNLPPGKYTFKLKSWTMLSKNNASKTTFSFVILPPFWKTWWFYLVSIIGLIIIILIILHYFSQQILLRHNYEMEKKHRESDLKLNEERMQFYTTVTHELRTPLTLILGPIHDLKKSPNLNKDEQKRVDIMSINANRLLSLTDQILELRQLELNKRKLTVGLAYINEHIQHIFNSFFELNQKKEIKLVADIQKNMLPVFFDKEAMTIILYNLLHNAIKYTSKGTVKLLVKQNSMTKDVTIKVIDTGIGIPENKVDDIYKRWFRAHTEKHIQGAGIGLSIVKSLIDLHDGKIEIESTSNEGTTFTVTLSGTNQYTDAIHVAQDSPSVASAPLENSSIVLEDRATNDDKIKTEIDESNTTDKKVLIVEDEPNIAEYISDSLDSDFDTHIVHNGQEAMEFIAENNVDLIVSDLMMPVMDGMELCKQIKQNAETRNILFIMLTAQEKLSFKEEAYSAGADSYLTKPFSSTLLKSRIQNLIKKHEEEHNKILENAQSTLFKNKQKEVQKQLNRQDEEFIENVRCLILENIEYGNVNVNFLADNLNMSTSTIYRKFKKILGISTKEFITQLTMEKAEILLLSMDKNINEISDTLGFSSTDYFRLCFKEHFGVSPTIYINQFKKDSDIEIDS